MKLYADRPRQLFAILTTYLVETMPMFEVEMLYEDLLMTTAPPNAEPPSEQEEPETSNKPKKKKRRGQPRRRPGASERRWLRLDQQLEQADDKADDKPEETPGQASSSAAASSGHNQNMQNEGPSSIDPMTSKRNLSDK